MLQPFWLLSAVDDCHSWVNANPFLVPFNNETVFYLPIRSWRFQFALCSSMIHLWKIWKPKKQSRNTVSTGTLNDHVKFFISTWSCTCICNFVIYSFIYCIMKRKKKKGVPKFQLKQLPIGAVGMFFFFLSLISRSAPLMWDA